MTQIVQHFHERTFDIFGELSCFGGETFSLITPDTSTLISLLNEYTLSGYASIFLSFGHCKCHPKDRFIKKEGIRISKERMVSTQFKVVDITLYGKYATFILSCGTSYSIQLKTYLLDLNSKSRLIKVTYDYIH